MTRDFNPSNEPGTCLYCGAKLRHTVWKEAHYQHTVSLCCQAPVDRQMVRAPERLANWRDVTFCTRCNRELVGDTEDTETVTRTTPERRSERAGYDNIFCTRDCGYQFGLAFARLGRRLKPAAEATA